MAPSRQTRTKQQGYILLAVMLFMTLMLIAMAVAAPRIAQQIQREKEEELIHRGEEYSGAIKKFYRRSGGQYPLTLEQLENTNRIRFLRKRYKDPMTGKDDWRLLHPGEVQIGIGGAGSNPPPGGSTNPPTGSATNPPTGSNPPNTPQTTSPDVTLTATGTANVGNQQPGASGGPIIGVASRSKAASIKERKGKTHYNEWIFIYDPRLEALQNQPGTTNPNPSPK